MRIVTRLLILAHRYLGIALSIPITLWFLSGIVMIYARGMPSLSPEERLRHLPAIDSSSIRLSPAQALQKAELGGPPDSAKLLTILGRPAYRFMSGGPVTVFADTGEILQMSGAEASRAATLFLGAGTKSLGEGELHNEQDQWTIAQRPPLPVRKFTLDDPAHTELYVSEPTGEVAVLTTRTSRAVAWISAIPHWMYFRALRADAPLWRAVVLWVSGLGTISTLLGLILAAVKYRRRPPHIPYAGWMRWHYISGVLFGLFTLTWVFSGFLSMEPWFWASIGGLGDGMSESMAGGPLDLTQFPSAIPPSDGTGPIKEVEYLRALGEPYLKLKRADSPAVLVSATSLRPRSEMFSTTSLLERLKTPSPNVPVLESTLLEDYDSYYYAFERKAPLPVLRVKFGDPDSTWFYVDPGMGEIVGRATRRERLQRWIYHGLHSLDFSFWYYSRPTWDIGMIGLCLGGAVLGGIGIVISAKRLLRGTGRILRRTYR